MASSLSASSRLPEPIRLWLTEFPRDRVPLLCGGARCGEGGEAEGSARDSLIGGVEGGELEGAGGRGGRFDGDLTRVKLCVCFGVCMADVRFDVKGTPLAFSKVLSYGDAEETECGMG